MKIAIDLRSLSSGNVSGVENYTMNLVEKLLKLDKKNQYVLFYNAFDGKLPGEYHYVNSRVAHSRIPNKILNLAFKFGRRKIEDFTGQVDWFFMPNLNQYSLLPNTKLAITVHDMSPVIAPEFYNLKRKMWHWFLNYKKAFERANVIFAVSEYTKNDIVRLFGIPEQKIKVVYPGVDTSIFNPQISEQTLRELRNQKNIPGKYFLFLNTIEPRKNLENLVKAFENLQTDSFLVIAGKSGWKNSKIFRQIQKSSKREKIVYLNYVSESEKPALIKMSRALIYPSFYEGFGFQPLEAMSMGVPVIASQVTAIPEVVGNAAILVNPYNVNDLTAAMGEVLKNEPLRDMLIKKGLERVGSFKWEDTALKVLNSFVG